MPSTRNHNVSATCALLEELLTRNSRYADLWQKKAARRRARALNQAAVSRVVSRYLINAGLLGETDHDPGRGIKDRISRALTGRMLSAETLNWMIEAFDMTQEDSERLLACFYGWERTTYVVTNTLRSRREMISRQRHRTTSLFERYTIGVDGLTTRRTFQTIRATEDGVSSYIFNHEPQATRVEVVHGGSAGWRHWYGGGLSSTEIVLDRPLAKSESTNLEYWTYFAPGAVRPTEVRRAAFARSENVDIAVGFEDVVPRAAWWCAWDDHIAGECVQEECVELRGNTIRQFASFIENTVVGLRWAL